jgi:hypothetical protein
VSPRFSTQLHPEGHGLAERYVGSIKQIINKLTLDHPKQWHKVLSFVLWSMREVPNRTTGVPPNLLCFRRLLRGPLSILKESWTGDRDIPIVSNRSIEEYLNDLKQISTEARDYADEQSKSKQQCYVSHYNSRSRDKHFDVNDSVLILLPDSTTSKTFSKWRGSAKVVEVKSPHSYIVDLGDGQRQHWHANRLRRYNGDVDGVKCASASIFDTSRNVDCSCAVIYEDDVDFGRDETNT